MKRMVAFIVQHKLIFLGLLINLLFYVSASYTRWFNYLFSGSSLHLCCRGLDFYQIPNGLYAYLHGGTLAGPVAPDGSVYGVGFPASNPNVYHPLFTLIVGHFLMIFPPASSFYVWMFLKLLLTLGMVVYFYQNFRESKYVDLAIFLALINTAQYIEIEISQFQFFLNVFVLLFLINIAKGRNTLWNAVFFFASLLVKPIGLLWLPLLLFKGRYKILFPGLLLFIAGTGVFLLNHTADYYTNNLLTHFLSPVGYGPIQIITLDAWLRYSTSIPGNLISYLKTGTLGTIVFLSAFKNISLVKGIYLAAVYFLLFYDMVFEYHYTLLIPVLAVCLVACPEFQSRLARILLTIIALPNAFFLLRLLHIGFVQDPFLGTDPNLFGWQVIVLSRIIPLIALTGVVIWPNIKIIAANLWELWRVLKAVNEKRQILG